MSGTDRLLPQAYTVFADALPNTLCILNRDGRIVFVNKAWRRQASENGADGAFLGIDYPALCDHVGGAEKPEARKIAQGLRALLEGRLETFTRGYSCTTTEGPRWFLLQASSLDGSYFVIQHVPTSEPVPSGRSSLDTLAQVAHELRSPLTSISGFTQLLALDDGKGTASDRADYITALHASTSHIAGLVDDMLDMARSQSGGEALKLREEACDLTAVMAAARDMVSALAAQRCVSVVLNADERSIAPGDGTVLADRRRLTQVLVNLLTNAIKFSKRGGTVTCRLAADHTGALRVEVADRGPGISAEEIPLAMAPYGRTSSARVTGAGGLGIGLPLSKALMEMHGGALSLDSTPGEGTVASLHLPASRRGKALPDAEDDVARRDRMMTCAVPVRRPRRGR